jgi:UDP:flavonoid glycosyltransferase YjiC (YdhE family)
MKVLFCSVDSPGHLYPLIGTALRLRERGHEVAFATGLPARGTLEAAGLERIARGPRDGSSFWLNTWFAPLRTAIDVKHVQHAVRTFAPDLLVTHQLNQAPLIVREMEGIPVAVMGMFSYLWPVEGSTAGRSEAFDRTRQWRVNDSVRILNEARALFRMPALEVDLADFPPMGDLFMLRCPPGMEPDLDVLPPQVQAVGPCLWEPEHPADAWDALRARFAAPDAPVIYAQQGRTFRKPGFWPHLVELLADQPVQVVASTSRMDYEAGELPANFLAEPHVPQGLVMAHARAVVTGGTSTPVLGALAHGLPSVIAPTGGETVENADKVVQAGCGVSLAADVLSPGTLREALDRVMADGQMRARCREVAGVFAATDSFGQAADLVEELGAGQARVDRPAAALAAA